MEADKIEINEVGEAVPGLEAKELTSNIRGGGGGDW